MAVDVLGQVPPVWNSSVSILDPLAKVFTPKHTFSRSILSSNWDGGKISSKSYLDPLAKACYPNIVSFTTSVLNPMAKPYKTYFDDSSHSPNSRLLNPKILPF